MTLTLVIFLYDMTQQNNTKQYNTKKYITKKCHEKVIFSLLVLDQLDPRPIHPISPPPETARINSSRPRVCGSVIPQIPYTFEKKMKLCRLEISFSEHSSDRWKVRREREDRIRKKLLFTVCIVIKEINDDVALHNVM